MSEDLDKDKKKLPLGKLNMELLKDIFQAYTSDNVLNELEKTSDIIQQNYEDSKKRVKLGFSIGEDAALIDMGEKYLVSKTDPITFATDEIGYYVVNINANDIASMGAVPKWFSVTILLPEGKTTSQIAKEICIDIQKSCLQKGIVLTGGHTEVTYNLDRPIVVGSMLGEVDKDNYVQTSGGKPGDTIILTKGIPLEGTSIIAREKEADLLKKNISGEVIKKAKNYLHDPGISVVKEALLATNNFNIHSMHDPTEGGLAMGLVEMARASNCGFEVSMDEIPILKEGKILCDTYNLNPLNVISSGALLIALKANDADKLINKLQDNGIFAKKIGNLNDTKMYKININGELEDLYYTEKDEITKIFD